jgi:vacuolar iron transporter family protein
VTTSESPRIAPDSPHAAEARGSAIGARLNWLRAGVLGADDGIVSTAGLVVGVAAATTARGPVLAAGLAGLAAGAVAMALGEYVSVSSQRDSERAMVAKERRELADDPPAELAELTEIYRRKGLSPATAAVVAAELTENDVLAAHLDAELGLDADALTNPWHAALASGVSFTLGALLPLAAILIPPVNIRITVTVVTVLLALALAGAISARIGSSPTGPATLRIVAGGAAAMAITYGIGQLVGTTTL